MIRINLLPIDDFRKLERGKQFAAVLTCFSLFIVGILFATYYFYMVPEIDKIKEENEHLATEKSNLEDKNLKLKQVIELVVGAKKYVDEILTLEARRHDQTEILLALDKIIPLKNSWLLSYQNKDNILSITGLATDLDTVSVFYNKLLLLPFVDTSVTTISTEKNNDFKIELEKFYITIKTNMPSSLLVEKGIPEVNFPSKEEFDSLLKKYAPDLNDKATDGADSSNNDANI